MMDMRMRKQSVVIGYLIILILYVVEKNNGMKYLIKILR